MLPGTVTSDVRSAIMCSVQVSAIIVVHILIFGEYAAQVQMALRHKGARDDITVIVVDAMSSSEDRLPCLLQRTGNGSLQADNAPAHTVSVLKPLELQDSCRPWYPLTW